MNIKLVSTVITCWILLVGYGGRSACEISADCPTARFLQISDLHLKEWHNSEHFRKDFGDISSDLRIFALQFASRLAPQAVLLTGDLTDGKALNGQGSQREAEWKAYRDVLNAFKADGGIHEADILDVPGNHDVFSVIQRQGPTDLFSRNAASGRRNASERIHIRAVHAGSGGPTQCPSAILLGIDPTPEVSYSGNFLGRANPSLLSDLDKRLTAELAHHRAEGCAPTLLAYGHYPLQVITQAPGAAPHSDGKSGNGWRSVKEVLLSHGVAAYVSGHLHSVFGRCLHRLLPNSFGGYLADLESAAWKDDRAFRVMTVYNGSFSFSDLFFIASLHPKKGVSTPQKHHYVGNASFAVSGLEGSGRVVKDWMVHMVAPPNARYSPLGLPQGPTEEAVALLVYLPSGLPAHKPKVHFRWRCRGGEGSGKQQMSSPEEPSSLLHFSTAFSSQKAGPVCGVGDIADVQVVVDDDGSSSEVRPVRVSLLASRQGAFWEGEAVQPLPLQQTPLERFLVSVDWDHFAQRLFLVLWSGHFFGLLLLPALFRRATLAGALRDLPQAPQPGLLGFCGRVLAAPAHMSEVDSIWWPLVAYSIYMLVGPWCAVRAFQDHFPGLLFRGSLLYRSQGVWHTLHGADLLRLGVVHYISAVLPGTLWLIALCFRWRSNLKMRALQHRQRHPGEQAKRAAMEERRTKRWFFGIWQWLGLLYLYLHFQALYRHAYLPYGRVALLLSPGVAWFLLWKALLVCHIYRLAFRPLA
eukprot:jgi/Botrbrau1/14247/Bobra.0381s0008.2